MITLKRSIISAKEKTQLVSASILAFNVNDQFDIEAVSGAANRLARPLILMVSANAIQFAGLGYLTALLNAARSECEVPLLFQLDHGRDPDLISACIERGFDLVMADFSDRALAENIVLTKKVVTEAHANEVLVEGEVGVIPDSGSAFGQGETTSPDGAAEFAAATGVDLLAISVGNVHGFSRSKPMLEQALIRSVKEVVGVPLVLHGGDFHDHAELRSAISNGISKINFGPELRVQYLEALKSGAVNSTLERADHRPVLASARVAVERLVAERLIQLVR